MTSNETEKNTTEKTAFAVVLVISLVAAQAVVNLRSFIRLSPPIELNKSGLSVSMPRGSAWKNDEKWKFNGDGFAINSSFNAGDNMSRSYARCHYILAEKQMTLQEHFNEYAAIFNSEPVETGQISIQGMVVDWAKISDANEQTPSVPFEIMFGFCRLPEGRCLEIEVLTTEDEKGLASKIFNAIIKSIRFRDNGLLKAGIQIVSGCKSRGLSEPLNRREKQVFFSVLTDASNRPAGFTMDAMATEQNPEARVNAASYFYRKGRPSEEEIGFFKANASFTKFTWRIENRAGSTGKGLEISAEDQNLMIKEQGSEKEHIISKAAVPEIIIDTVLETFADGNQYAVIIDIIGADGTISPLYAEKTEPEKDGNQIINVELLSERAAKQKIYFDKSKNIVKTVFANVGVLTPSTAEEIAKLFPERASLVLSQNRLLDTKGI
jgi:hypothetical protein